LIEFKEVEKVYQNGVHALKKMNLHISEGEFVLVIGESGAGKSTLNKLITREEKATSGEVIVNGFNLSLLKEKDIPRLRKSIGMVFQEFRLLSKMTVFENVAFAQEAIGVPLDLIHGNVSQALATVGLDSKANYFPKELSGGEQQRVAIARAIVNRPQIIVADEPTGNLDSKMGEEILGILFGLNKKCGSTIVIVTHDREIAKRADRILEITDGRLV